MSRSDYDPHTDAELDAVLAMPSTVDVQQRMEAPRYSDAGVTEWTPASDADAVEERAIPLRHATNTYSPPVLGALTQHAAGLPADDALTIDAPRRNAPGKISAARIQPPLHTDLDWTLTQKRDGYSAPVKLHPWAHVEYRLWVKPARGGGYNAGAFGPGGMQRPPGIVHGWTPDSAYDALIKELAAANGYTADDATAPA